MAIINTVGSVYMPFSYKESDYTPMQLELLQTIASAATQGAFSVFSSATSSNDFFLSSILVSRLDATGGSYSNLYGGTDILTSFATMSAASNDKVSLFFGIPGLNVGTTTTATVSMLSAGGTVTTKCVAIGYRKK